MQRGVSAIRSATDRVSSTVSGMASGENRPTGTSGNSGSNL
jgi:hypothetical protein